MFANNDNRLLQVCVLLVLIHCFLRCKANLEGFPNCTYPSYYIGDGYCDYFTNNEACGWDGGDCCECTCVLNLERDSSCEPNSFSCMNQDSGCVNSSLLEYINCSNGYVSPIGNGLCDPHLNNEACGWDGGDCCECTCAPDCEGENGDDFFCLDPNSECADPTLLKYTNCTGYVALVGNGYCTYFNNNEACGWDGGDCCECTCQDEGYFDCGDSKYFCRDPDSGCTDPLFDKYINCTGELLDYGNGWCNSENYNEACGWDGGDCCECTCEGKYCASNLEYDIFECLDPEAADKSPLYGCLDWPPASIPCPSQKKQHWKVETTSQARDLAKALNCSGGVFEVTWNGSVIIDHTIFIFDGTVMSVTGIGSNVTIDGRGNQGLLTTWNASLYISNMVLINGNSTSGGAIAALGSEVSLSRTIFSGNVATFSGGALFMGEGSTLTCGDETRFYNNSAVHRGGAISLRGRGNATWTGAVKFVSNSAGIGGAVDISFGSSVSWSAGGGSTFLSNNAIVFGSGLNIFTDSSARWEGGSTFEGNIAAECGGGMYISGSKATWEGESTFEGNTAAYSGGGVYVSNSKATWEGGSIFEGNTAGHTGGGVFIYNSSVAWTGKISSFSRNYVLSYGGAVCGTYRSNISWTR